MNKQPHIKILILNWNGEKIIKKCIDSINNLSYSNYSIGIIDNGSTDNSLNIISTNYPDIKIYKINKNLGYAKGYNYAFNILKEKTFDYYLLLNNDAFINKTLLKDLRNNLIEYGEKNIYSPKIKFYKKNRLWFAGGLYNKVLGYTKHIGLNKNENDIFYKTSQCDYVSGCSMLISKALVQQLKGFDTMYNMYYEDVDLCHRASKLSIKCYVIEESTILHNVSYSIGNNSFKKFYKNLCSRIKFIYKFNNLAVFFFGILGNIVLFPIYLLKVLYKLITKS